MWAIHGIYKFSYLYNIYHNIQYILAPLSLAFQPQTNNGRSTNPLCFLKGGGFPESAPIFTLGHGRYPRRENHTHKNMLWGEPRTEEESRSIFEDGYQFLKIYKSLTCISLRLGPLRRFYLKDFCLHNLTGLISCFGIILPSTHGSGLVCRNGFFVQSATYLGLIKFMLCFHDSLCCWHYRFHVDVLLSHQCISQNNAIIYP